MAEIINLRRVRKSRKKAQAEAQAAGKRAGSGANPAARRLADARSILAIARHEGHRLANPPPARPPPDDG